MAGQLPAGTLSSGPPGPCLSLWAAPAPDADSPPSSSAPLLCPWARPQTAQALPLCTVAWCPESEETCRRTDEIQEIHTVLKMLEAVFGVKAVKTELSDNQYSVIRYLTTLAWRMILLNWKQQNPLVHLALPEEVMKHLVGFSITGLIGVSTLISVVSLSIWTVYLFVSPPLH